jgi:nicotinamidase-related amidase
VFSYFIFPLRRTTLLISYKMSFLPSADVIEALSRFDKNTTAVVTCNLNTDRCTDEKTRNCKKALSLFRNFSLPIIHTDNLSDTEYPKEHPRKWFDLLPNELVKGSFDIGSAFTNTDLMDQLKALGVHRLLFIGGYMTSNAGTMIEAWARTFECCKFCILSNNDGFY